MISPPRIGRPRLEYLDTRPDSIVDPEEYRRLLGYPRGHVPGERSDELASWARRWYGEHGRPWIYMREAELALSGDALRIDGTEFGSTQLHDHLVRTGAQRIMLVAVSAGRGAEEHARRLWDESKPDEYFFLAMYASAVVEHLVASLSGRICDLAEREGMMAVPHYSPGYAGWDVADQVKLFDLVMRLVTREFPEPMEVLPSGMLRPAKSLLAVVGLAVRTEAAPGSAPLVPCEGCSFSSCHYRRMPYRHSTDRTRERAARGLNPFAPKTKYGVNERALRKWARERVLIERHSDGSVSASFRFDGTTCSNMGRALAFDYSLELSGPNDGYAIRRADCRPAPGDEGHAHMCAYMSDAGALMKAIADEKPPLGRPLDDVLPWSRTAAASGCHCTPESRTHKWGLALEAIHFALSQSHD